MSLTVNFKDRTFSTALAPAGVKLTVTYLSRRAIGGPYMATIHAEGDPKTLCQLVDYLRYEVDIYDGHGSAVWWGMINEVELTVNGIKTGLSLSDMANRVAVAYSYIAPGSSTVGTRKTTAYAEDTFSSGLYGVKEKLYSVSGASDDQATKLRDRELVIRATPQALPPVRGDGNFADIYCIGWFWTLDWQHVTIATTPAISYLPSGDIDGHVGTATSQKWGQQFTVGASAFSLYSVSCMLSKTGSPSDNLVIAIQADSSDSPSGTNLASATVAPALIPALPTRSVIETLLSVITLTAGAKYWIVWSRSGATDDSNYFRVRHATAAGYSGGLAKYYNGSTWVTNSTDAYFSINTDNQVDSTAEISAIIANAGQFISAVDIDAVSGVKVGSYRDGDTVARAEIEKLLSTGNSTGSRLLADVSIDRRLRIYAEPASSTVDLYQDAKLQLVTGIGKVIPAEQCPAGVWCGLKNVFPVTLTSGAFASLSPFFIEEGSWSPDGGYVPTPRGVPSPMDLLRITNGN